MVDDAPAYRSGSFSHSSPVDSELIPYPSYSYEISPPQNSTVPRQFPRLTFEKYGQFHRKMIELGSEDISWKIGRCGIDASRLDCPNHLTKWKYVPIMCRRRICPSCAWLEMRDRFTQFKDILFIIEETNRGGQGSFRVRHWTHTMRNSKIPLKEKLSQFKTAFNLFWRYSHGDRAKFHEKEKFKPGAIIVLEVQGNLHLHSHSLIYGPFLRASKMRTLWASCLRKAGASGSRLRIDLIDNDSANRAYQELISYPLRPDKSGKHNQLLMAEVEHAFRGQRRYILKGSFYNRWARPVHNAICPECLEKMTVESNLDSYIDRFKKAFFDDTPEGRKNYEKYSYKFPSELFNNMPSKNSII